MDARSVVATSPQYRSALGGGALLSLAALLLALSGCGPSSLQQPQDLAEEATTDADTEVVTGLERIARGEDQFLRGRRIGLIAHRASTTRDGRHAIDVLHDRELDLVRIFAPEHGLRGEAAAGESVASGIDPQTGLPITSLYGERRAPSAADIAGLDTLVFDLQDAGVRFYTYISTMILTLEAASEAGLEYVVLDRPNPLGGVLVDGPLAAPREDVPESLVNMAPGPLVHGMTAGEMAQLVHARRAPDARLSVVEMTGWSRHMIWSDTNRPWVAPSPNLRTAEAALAYPGVALFESTNISEGRGTEAPFLVFGAPWIGEDNHFLGSAPSGIRLEPIEFEPVGSPAAPHPKWNGDRCRGYRLRIEDADLLRPAAMGVQLLAHFQTAPEFEWRQGGDALTWLVGTPALIEALRAGRPAEGIISSWQPGHDSWREEREPFLLYR